MGRDTLGIMNNKKEKLLKELENKEYRDAFVSELIDTGIPFQIRALRGNLTQKEFSKKIGMLQERVSVLEDPNYAKLTLTTLKRIASGLDIGLLVRFVPISDLVKWELTLSPDSLKAVSYDKDPYFSEEGKEETILCDTYQYTGITPTKALDNVIIFQKRKSIKTTSSTFEKTIPITSVSV